ncbi:MAG: hypothetical protein WKF97_25015 [Chitinophagaceae bacterium]
MKKLIITASMLLALGGFSFAQTSPAKTQTKTSTYKQEVKKDGKVTSKTTTSKEATTSQTEAKPGSPATTKTATKKSTQTVKKKSGNN